MGVTWTGRLSRAPVVPRLLAVVGLGVLWGASVAVAAYGLARLLPIQGVGWVSAALGFMVFSAGLERLLEAGGVRRARTSGAVEASSGLTAEEEARFQEARAQLREYEPGRDGLGELVFWLFILGLSVLGPAVDSLEALLALAALPVAHELGHRLQSRALGYKDAGVWVVLFAQRPQLGAILGALGWFAVGVIAADHGSWAVGLLALGGIWWSTWRYRLARGAALLRLQLGTEALPLWAKDAPDALLRRVVLDWRWRQELGRTPAMKVAVVMSRVYQQATLPALSRRTQGALVAAHLAFLLPLALVLRRML